MEQLPLREIILIAVYAGHLVAGVRRRRPYWRAASWRRFGVLVALGFVFIAVALRMARGVDDGVYDGMTRLQHDAYLYGMFALLLVGVGLSAGLTLWLAHGNPQRELGGRRHPKSQRPTRSAV